MFERILINLRIGLYSCKKEKVENKLKSLYINFKGFFLVFLGGKLD